MINAPHVVETALLLLVAFLIGAVLGYVARVLAARGGKAPAVVVAAVGTAPISAPAGPQLVTAPAIAPLPSAPKASAAERLAAAAGKPVETPPPAEAPKLPQAEETPLMPAVEMPSMAKLPDFVAPTSLLPARVAGETLSGKHIENPEHAPAAAELALEPAPYVQPAVAAVGDSTTVLAAESEPEPTKSAEVMAEAEPMPESASLADVRAELEAQIDLELLTQPDEPQPVETRIEPEVEPEPQVEVLDAPKDVAAEIQHVIELAADEPIPDVVSEAPLVDSSFDEDIALPSQAVPAVEEKPPTPTAEIGELDEADAEAAAMRAIEGGWSPRRTKARSPAPRPEGVPIDVVAADAAVAASSAAVASATAAANAVLEDIEPARAPAGGFGRPATLTGPRDGQKDDFSQIKGLAPAIESSLNGLGIYHYDQIAAWDQKAVVWVESHFGFKGRVSRERWQEQARELARGRTIQTARPVRR